MQVGLSVWLDRPVLDLVDLALEAEEAGFADIWLPDHYFLRDVYVASAAMAARTSTIRLATGVVAAQLRHPALIASAAATIDELSRGRAVVGVGPGGHEFASQFNMRPKSPLTMLREAVAVIRDLLGEGSSRYEGTYFAANGSALGWTPRTLPIYMSARGPRMLEMAGELADGVIIHGTSAEFINYVREKLAVGASRVGRDPGDCEVAVMLDVEIDDDEQAAVDRLRPRCTIMAGGSYSDALIPIYGLEPQAVADLRGALSTSAPDAGRFVTDQMVNAFAIGGSVQTLEARLQELKDLGVGRAILKLGEGDPANTLKMIRLIQPTISGVSK